MSNIFSSPAAGLRVDDRETLIYAIPRADLPTSPLLPKLFTLTSDSFHGIQKQPVLPPDLKRFGGGVEQYLGEIRHDGWTFVLSFADDAQDILGTFTVVPGASKAPDPTAADQSAASSESTIGGVGGKKLHPAFLDMAEIELVDGEARWTLRLLCVNVNYQRRGIADWLMQFAEDVVVRFEVQKNATISAGVPTTVVRFLLTTIEELTGAYYAKRGWLIFNAKKMPPGFIGSEGGFTLIDMYKMVPIVATSRVQSPMAL
ncbi:hypothetical protein BKA62DRAFT_833833 [Auriculariales sp. MPI-PUGE-AT-0066]|nr:hypothetical protein BKA62DRAFT_833833 [Auriculariales sp. MPI-PUGE-AT-0066]